MPHTQRFAAWQRAIGARLSQQGRALVDRVPSLGIDESTLLIGFALAIGATVGVAVVVFFRLIDLAQEIALGAAARVPGAAFLSIAVVVLAGLVLARLLVVYGANDSDGENIPSVLLAVAKRGACIHVWPPIAKLFSTAILIGTGGSVGPEGPVAVAGAGLGSRLGRFFRSGAPRLRVLVACGAAAGISAAFNAPIAGVFFSLEKILGSFGVSAFPPILVASVIAAAISRAAFGNSPVIGIPREYGIGSTEELLLYALMGIALGVVAVAFTRVTSRTTDLMARIGRRSGQVLVAAAVLAGLNIVFRADLWGSGHETLRITMLGERTWYFLLALAAAKLVATAFTLTAARCGGIFTPALFIGATFGGGFAVTVDQVFGFHVLPEAFGLVGMAGMVAGATHAPLTAIMIVFEMTGDYQLILPLMLTGALAYLTARRLHPDSIYSAWLTRRGENIVHGRDEAILERLTVRSCYNANPDVIGENATVEQIIRAIGSSTQMEFPVLDTDRRFIGMLTYNALRAVVSDRDSLAPVVVAADLVEEGYASVTPDDSLRTALKRLAVSGGQYIPVVAPDDAHRLLGVVSRTEIFAAYDRALLAEAEYAH